MFQVVKRDGEIAEFQMSKITAAIDKAFDAKEKVYSKDMIDLMALRVTADFQNKITDGKVTVEDIQDSVENVLIQPSSFQMTVCIYTDWQLLSILPVHPRSLP